jgi:spore coat polysaccharide biosynthesis predicted glycosyltransferase SpsG
VSDGSKTGGVLFRVASRPSAGGGHLSRCLAVAAALQETVQVLMVLDPGGRCEKAGVPVTDRMPDEPARWRACLLDGYHFTAADFAYYMALAPLAVFDDFCRPPPGAALAINAAFHLGGDTLGGVPALLGPRYAAIDPRFAAVARPIRETVEHVVVSFGRVDPDDATGRALAALALLRGDGFAPRVTVAAAPRRELADTTFRVDVEDMALLLADADLVIGAGGVSLYERIAAGVPSVTVAIADNQRLAVEGAAAAAATAPTQRSPRALADAIGALAADPERRREMASRGRALVDGRGAQRVAKALMRLPVGAGAK